MATLAPTFWLSTVLRLIPGRLHKLLDDWSYGLARERAAKRRLAGRAAKPAAPSPAGEQAPVNYKLKPWRD